MAGWKNRWRPRSSLPSVRSRESGTRGHAHSLSLGPASVGTNGEPCVPAQTAVAARTTIALSRPGEFLQHRVFEGQRLLHTRVALHARKMRGAVRKTCGVHVKLRAAPHAP